MEAGGHTKCYGNMLPAITFPPRKSSFGKVFSFEVQPSGGLGPPERSVKSNGRQWEECRDCGEFDHCYKFSMMKTALEFMVFQM